MGGIGKTVLAATFAHDPAVLAAFPDGIFWLASTRRTAAKAGPSIRVDVDNAQAQVSF